MNHYHTSWCRRLSRSRIQCRTFRTHKRRRRILLKIATFSSTRAIHSNNKPFTRGGGHRCCCHYRRTALATTDSWVKNCCHILPYHGRQAGRQAMSRAGRHTMKWNENENQYAFVPRAVHTVSNSFASVAAQQAPTTNLAAPQVRYLYL